MYTGEDITLYVPYYNAARTIGACLEAVRAQTVAPARVLVIDDGSPEPLPCNGVEVIRHGENRGLAAGRNTALEACETPLLAALDADVVPEPDWLEGLLAAINEHNVSGVGGRMTERYAVALADRWRSIHMAQHWGDAPVRNPRFVYGANTLFKADVLRAVGGYDLRLKTNDEDRTICEALYERGEDLFYAPAARCRHLRRDTCRTVLRSYWQWHHARGIRRGQFDSSERLIERIGRVGFGIFRYRFDLDRQAGRSALLGLDAAIPWVFSMLDLGLFERRRGQPPPEFATAELFSGLPPIVGEVLTGLARPPDRAGGSDWHEVYVDRFRRCLERSNWVRDCAGRWDIWRTLLEELSRCDS